MNKVKDPNLAYGIHPHVVQVRGEEGQFIKVHSKVWE
jgi:hypothetical protein